MNVWAERKRLVSAVTGAAVLLALLAVIKVVVHLLTGSGYGYFVDELYYLGMQPHLDFGYVDVPPAVPALMAVSNAIFGTSLLALKVLPAIAGALTLMVVALMARELGGGRFAVVLAGLAVLVAPMWLALDSWFAYDAFDQLVTALLFWAWIRLMKEPSPRRWLVVGLVLGIGLLTKMSIVFTWPALAVALLATSQRRSLLTRWPWLAAGLALLVASPFIAWQATHGWPIVAYWQGYAQYRPHPSVVDFAAEILLWDNEVLLPLTAMGLIFFLAHRDAARYRSVGITVLVLAALFALILHSEPRLLASALLPLIAGGAVWLEKLLAYGSWRPKLKPAYAGLLVISGLVFGFQALPIGGPATWADHTGGAPLPEHLYLRVGWPELVAEVANVYNGLPPDDRARAVIYAGNYGEAAAIDFFGPQYGLPGAISNNNAYQVWGPGDGSGEVAIAFGYMFSPFGDHPGAVNLSNLYGEVRWGGVIEGLPDSPSWEQQVPIWICRDPLVDLHEVWPQLANYR
jgi:hypothetical protein